MGGRYMIPLRAENRAQAGVVAGGEVDADFDVDTEPREVAVPPDFAAALDLDPGVRQRFDGLSYSRQRQFVLGVEGAKTAETRR